MNVEYDQQIRNLCNECKRNYPQVLKSKKFSYLWSYILSQTKFLQEFEKQYRWKFKASTYVNWTLNYRICFSCCKTCGKPFDRCDVSWDEDYSSFCSIQCMNKSPSHMQHVSDTLQKRYGARFPAQVPQFHDKMEQTNMRLYGVKNGWQLPKVKENANKPEVKAKRLATLKKYNIEHHGVQWYVQSDAFKEKTRATNGTSKEEQEIIAWLKTAINDDIVVGSYKIIPPLQLDAYVPSLKLAIEFNGTYYHSIEHGNDVNYHLNKTKACEEQDIKLIHIWEDEWTYRKDEVKQFMLDVINGKIDISQHVINENDGTLSLDRSKFNRCMVPSNYEIIGETSPEIVLRAKTAKDKYKVPDCGKLLLKLKNM